MIYFLGTLYEVCNGEPPFQDTPRTKSEAAKFPTIQEYYADEDLRTCITNCLSFDKDQRPEAAEIHNKAREKLKETKYKDALRYQLLLEAVEKDSLESVESCLEGYNLTDFMGVRRCTPLHRAVQYRRINIVKKLLEKGFRAFDETEKEETPLHMALESNEKILQLKNKISKLKNEMLESMNETTESKVKKLESKIKTLESEDDQMFQLLVKNIETGIWHKFYPRGWTLLHLAAAANSLHIVKRVLEDNPDWNFLTKGKQWSLIHIAARNGHVELLAYLLEQKNGVQAAIEKISEDEATPLFAASKRGQVETLSLLLEKGANINVQASGIKIRNDKSRSRITALHIAALGGHTETVQTLLRNKMIKIIRAKTDQDETALHLAVQHSHKSCPAVISLLVGPIDIEATANFQNNRKWTALHMAVENSNFEGTRELLKRGARPDAETEDGNTALHLAAAKGLKAVVIELLDKKANASKRNRYRATPLHEAIEKLKEAPDGDRNAMRETAKILIAHDQKLVSQETRYGEIALHLAAKNKNFSVFKAAYECNPAKVNKRNNDGETALHVAARADCLRIVSFLLDETDADIALKTYTNETPSMVATGASKQRLEDYGL